MRRVPIVSARSLALGLAMALPTPVRRGLAWLSQATFTVGVSAVLLDADGRILFLRHRYREQHGWELPGGFVGYGENLEEALRRELREETGYEIEIRSLLSANVSKWHHVDVCYLARIASGNQKVDAEEIIDARFFPYDELPADLKAQVPRHL